MNEKGDYVKRGVGNVSASADIKPCRADQPDFGFGMEFHQDIDIAVRSEIIPQHRTEQRKLANMMRAAKFFDTVSACTEPASKRIMTLLIRGLIFVPVFLLYIRP